MSMDKAQHAQWHRDDAALLAEVKKGQDGLSQNFEVFSKEVKKWQGNHENNHHGQGHKNGLTKYRAPAAKGTGVILLIAAYEMATRYFLG